MTDKELAYFIDYYYDSSINSAYLKNRKYSRNQLQELETEQEKRQKKVIIGKPKRLS